MVCFHRRRVLVHGTPITPFRLLEELVGESFCVSFAAPKDLDRVIRIQDPTGVLVLDNGAFSVWRQGKGAIDRKAFWAWANAAQERSAVAVAVVPDVIEGSIDENRAEFDHAETLAQFPERTMAIWHMNDPLEFLEEIVRRFSFVGVGSCSEFDIQKNRAGFMARMDEARKVIDRVQAETGRRPWVHVMRGLGRLHELGWVDSADSTNIARNHTRTKTSANHVRAMATRIRAKIEATAGELLTPGALTTTRPGGLRAPTL